jgi:AcrR family transcriptional regulator
MIQKDETRETITHIAGDLFARYGYQKTTMDDIARACRKGKSSIYYYFRNKEEIFLAVLENEIIFMRSRILLALAECPDPMTRLKTYVLTRMDCVQNLVNIYNALKNEYLSQFGFIERIRVGYDEEELSLIKGILDEGVASKIFAVEDTYATALALVTAMKGFEIPLFFKENPELHIERRLDMLLGILFYGLVKR